MRKSIYLATGLLLLAAISTGCRREKPYEKPLTTVRVHAVEEYRAGGGERYSANIIPHAQVDLSFKVGGYVKEILQVRGVDGRLRNLQEGDRVSKGAVMAKVRETDYEAKVKQARSQLLGEIASLEQAKLDIERATNLFATQSITKPEYDAAKAKFELAQARVEGAKARLEEAEIALRDCELKAPMDSLILKRNIEIGSLVGPGALVFILADVSSVKVIFGVPDTMLKEVKLGNPQTITTEAFRGMEFHGKITRISSAADPKSRVFDVEITIPNLQNRLKPGMIASLEVAGMRLTKPVTVVPLNAIVRSKKYPEDYSLFVLEEKEGKQVARARKVKLGEVFGNMIAATEGVNIGERVIVIGATLLVDGEQVRVIP
jgi:multidrug efflux system membrane fusion protein